MNNSVKDSACNWKLLYKYEEDTPVEFAELLWLDNDLFYRKGKSKTWGESHRFTFNSDIERFAEIENITNDLVKDNYKVEREWLFNPKVFDFSLLCNEIEIAANRAFMAIKRNNVGVNAFSITTDDSIMTIGPIANAFPSFKEVEDEQLWVAQEWSIWDGNEYFDIPYRLILSQWRDDLSMLDYSLLRKDVINSFTLALANLKNKKLFHTDIEQKEFILMVSVGNGYENPDSYKQLNHPKLYTRFKKWLDSWN